MFHGARSLGLGYSSLAFTYDVNMIHMNPALLVSQPYSISGYQYGQSYGEYAGFGGQLSSLLSADLNGFANLDEAARSDILDRLKRLYSSRAGFFGFRQHQPGFVGKGFGFSIAFLDAALIRPLANAALQKNVQDFTAADLQALQMSFIGMHGTEYGASYAFWLSQDLSIGLSLYYLKGHIDEQNVALLADRFAVAKNGSDYLQETWKDVGGQDLSKLTGNISLAANMGEYFKLGLLVRNVWKPTIKTTLRELTLPQRWTAGIAFRPPGMWGIYLDLDVKKADSFYNDDRVQPFSFGVEKGFLQNRFVVRAGILNDLSEKKLFGRDAAVLYGFGLGFNLSPLMIDLAVGLGGNGDLRSLAISGFYVKQ